ncbi:MAG TPA: 2Fe-2S iron-sulfur cluster-binding protein [Noviherbaspirillum sp.]|uniref:2Fe-2S iron-sulfur cluster-binding protein n=1 Tax=Noviherbaspirillum sp. TaxID=1926288 RepID=UPI002B484811|nr:2Fe-2S iron-sulfur cluster-binding protein [Noviherbaspirillum sp.]HJV84225.1 2Fe-2S iron-sulfur cluster-binding protein [Noviherbaspirillum sp.]
MTIQQLSSYIALAIALQVAAFVAVVLFQKWRDYRRVGSSTAMGSDAAPAQDLPPASEVPGSWSGYREFRVQRKEFEDRNQSICSFYCVPVDGQALPPFKPGQFLTFRLNVHTGRDAKSIVRCYSLSHAPDPGYYRVTIKRMGPPHGKPELPPGVSSNYFHDQVEVGTVLTVKAPSGHFYLRDVDQSPVVLIGGGIGITPMLSMLETTLSLTPGREVWLFYGIRNGREHIMKAKLCDLAQRHPNFHLHVCYSRPEPEDIPGRDFQHASHVNIGLLRQTLNLRPYHFYICGPRQMMESLVPALADWGVDPDCIHYEAFGPSTVPKLTKASKEPPAPRPAAAALPKVRFAASAIERQWDTRADSLLEFAEDLGLSVPSGCRAGSCGSCQTKIVSGEVETSKEPDFDVTTGCCLLCISKPKSDLVLSL